MLLLDDFRAAQVHFSNVLNLLPGEPAPKLAIAAINELILQELGYPRTEMEIKEKRSKKVQAPTVGTDDKTRLRAAPVIDPEATHMRR